jgi:hypothetical protein
MTQKFRKRCHSPSIHDFRVLGKGRIQAVFSSQTGIIPKWGLCRS